MSHVAHIAKNKQHLETRAQIIRLIREFFWQQEFLEMETPNLLCLPGQEPYLSSMKLTINNERGASFIGYLHTSPEYTLKKMLGAGFKNIFSLCKVYRDQESFGGTHNPEFTMIEWYRANEDFWKIMEDVEGLFKYIDEKLHLKSKIQNPNDQSNPNIQSQKFDHLDLGIDWKFGFGNLKFERLHMRDVWQRYAGVNLDDYLERDQMFALCEQKGYKPKTSESYEDLFYRIFLNEIEPHLGVHSPTIVHHYPACMAALSRLSPIDPRYAERFEVYVGGLELANCFSELVDSAEQFRRLQKDQEDRKQAGKEVFPIDMEFIEALKTMPPSAGIALGVDRLVQLFTGCKNIDDVLVLPASQLFDI
jgi:lysyl-tRNA synthetase class 2